MTDGRTTDGQTDGRTDGRTDRGDCNIPYAFLKKRGDKNSSSVCLLCNRCIIMYCILYDILTIKYK